MLRLLLLGASAASVVAGSAAAHEPGRYDERGTYSDRRGAAWDGSRRTYARHGDGRYQAPPWSSRYAYEASANRMWSSYSRGEWSYREAEMRDYGRYEYEHERLDHRDCRCGAELRPRRREVYLRPGPVYMDRRPVYIEQPPVYIAQPPIHIASPPIYVEGPPIYIESPPVYVEPPVVHLTPSPVHVAPPEVHVRPADVVHDVPPPPPPTHFGDLPPPDNIPPVAPPPAHGYRQEPGERG